MSEDEFNSVGAIAVGPVMPHIGDPEPLWAVIKELDMDGASTLRNFTGAGDATSVTIDMTGLADPGDPP